MRFFRGERLQWKLGGGGEGLRLPISRIIVILLSKNRKTDIIVYVKASALGFSEALAKSGLLLTSDGTSQ